MAENHLHPSVRQFREFINRHPTIRKEIRQSGRSWQAYYEKWSLLGEDDEYWDKFKGDDNEKKSEKKEDNKSELFSQLVKLTENVDIDKVQKQVHQLSGTISTIQELIDQYQGSKKKPETKEFEDQPFSWIRD